MGMVWCTNAEDVLLKMEGGSDVVLKMLGEGEA